AALERKDTLKRAYLSSEAVDAFYGEEESYDRFWIEKVKIMQHPQLTEVEKAQKIAEIELLLPDTLRRAMEQSQLANKLQEQTQQLLDKGGSAAELQQLRESSVGVAAAERLSALDSQRAQWQARVDTWFKQKDEIMQNRNLAETDKAQLLAELRGQYFNEAELRRVQALERIRDGAKSSFAAMPE
ncbi:MAG TPA: lipase secretion chaperone, partial [Pseudomonadales bacterium]|nr:lipase secretion chaperone [Pseudomonadales bacterium]